MPSGIYKRKIPIWNKGKKYSSEEKAKLNMSGLKPGWNKGKHTGIVPKSAFKKGFTPWNKGLKTGYNKKQADKIRGLPSWNKGKSYPQMIGNTHGFKKGKPSWNKGKEFLAIQGEKNHNWKGGLTPINEKIRKSTEYKLWRKAVYERDDYTCVWCGDNTSGNLNADHIKPFALFPELRFAIDNGRTLCKNCHRKTETYGWNYWVNKKNYLIVN